LRVETVWGQHVKEKTAKTLGEVGPRVGEEKKRSEGGPKGELVFGPQVERTLGSTKGSPSTGFKGTAASDGGKV